MTFDGESGSEMDIRRRIAELEAERVTLGDAYRSIHLGLGSILFTLGRANVLVVEVGILLASGALFLATRWVLLPLLGLVALVIWSLYIEFSIESWVEEHNKRIDDEIRLLLHGGADEQSDDGATWPAGR